MKRSREVFQPNLMDHYDTIWGLIIYGGDIDLKTAAKTSECCRLFHQISITSDIAKCYWKFKVLKCFKSFYEEDLSNKVNKTFKEFCYSYLTKVYHIAKNYEKTINFQKLSPKERLELYSLLNPVKEYLSETFANRYAQFCLGYCLQQRENKSTLNEFVKYYTLSADQGLLKAQTKLARDYDYGYSLAQDKELCFKYYKMAADQQIKILSKELKIDPFAGMGMSCRINLKDAFQHYKAVLTGEVAFDEKLLLTAARCHEDGIGTAVNVKKALNYYKVVKENSITISSLSVAKVAVCYELGI